MFLKPATSAAKAKIQAVIPEPHEKINLFSGVTKLLNIDCNVDAFNNEVASITSE